MFSIVSIHSDKGAFNKHTHVYSVQQVSQIIEYARLRGIRVLPEVDTPGHSLSWGKSHPELLTQCYEKNKPVSGSYGAMDPSKQGTFDFVQKFFTEVAKRFPEDFFHLGGDEVETKCWETNPQVQEFTRKYLNGDVSKIESYYIVKMLNYTVESLNKTTMVWQEVFDNKDEISPENTIVNVWISDRGYSWLDEMKNVTNKGFKAVVSAPWYLNYIGYGTDWYKYYQVEPCNFTTSQEKASLVLGGEACMWGEYVDASNLISYTW